MQPEPAVSSEDSPGIRDVDQGCPVSPRSIVEAILFVGHPENQPLSSRMIAALMRGVRPQEVDEIVVQLNEIYRQQATPYYVASVGAGYRMQLRDDFAPIRERFFGRLRRARLSQAAIDVLAIVAYSQPVDRQRIDQLRGRPSGAVLSQLVQRDLLRVERDTAERRRLLYFTTERFLDLFALDSLDDLPRHHHQS
jgi:segregation and condensation protein B